MSSKTGIPLDVLPQRELTAKQAERMQMINESDLPRVSTQPRSKNESKEDRKARKQAVKEERKVPLFYPLVINRNILFVFIPS